MSEVDKKTLSWKVVLREAMKQRQEMTDTTVLACGDENLPLPSLIAQRKQDPHESTFYDSFLVQHDSSSNDATVHVWSLSSLASHHRLDVGSVMKSEQLPAMVFVIVVDLSRPWRVMHCVKRWASRLDALVARLGGDLNSGELDSMRQAHFEYVQRRYAANIGLSQHDEDTEAALSGALPSLPDGMLEDNVGVPLIVVGCNSDLLVGNSRSSISSQYRANFVQLHLRRFCLSRGAALVFVPRTSSSMDLKPDEGYAHACDDGVGGFSKGASAPKLSNAERVGAPSALLLEQYLLHRLYPTEFRYSAAEFDLDPMRRDTDLFIASGQDSATLQLQLALGDIDVDSVFEDIVLPPNHGDGDAEPFDDDDDDDDDSKEGEEVKEEEEEEGEEDKVRQKRQSGESGGGSVMEHDDDRWLGNLKLSLSAVNAKRSVKSNTPAAAELAAVDHTTDPVDADLGSIKSGASKKTDAGAKDFFSSLLNN